MWHKRVTEDEYERQLAEWHRRRDRLQVEYAKRVRKMLGELQEIIYRRRVYDLQDEFRF